MNWSLVAAIPLCLICLLPMEVRFLRSNQDSGRGAETAAAADAARGEGGDCDRNAPELRR